MSSGDESWSVQCNLGIFDNFRLLSIKNGFLIPKNVVRRHMLVIKLEFFLRLKIKRNDWLLADTCPQAANNCSLF